MGARMTRVAARWCGWGALLIGIFASAAAEAFDGAPVREVTPWSELRLTEGWEVRLGIGAAALPETSGSDRYRTLVLPFVSVDWENRLSISPMGAVRFNLNPGGRLSFGPTVGYARGRRDRGPMSDLDRGGSGVTGGAFADYRLGPIRLSGRFEMPLGGSLEGQRVRLGARINTMPLRRVLIVVGPSLTWLSASWSAADYAISDAEALRTGLRPYRPDAGVTDVRVDANVLWFLSRATALAAFVSYGRLVGPAEDSPVVRELGTPDQAFAAVMVVRSL